MRINMLPFAESDIQEAAELLARRHQEDRAAEPALPERFIHSTEARNALEKTWRDAKQCGVVARYQGKLIGYLLGTPQISNTWGRSVWVELPGHAIDRSYGAELYRDLYAALSPSWVAAGCLAHYAVIPATSRDELDAWFNLSFGKEHVHGLRETAPFETFALQSDGELEIRLANLSDIDESLELDDIISRHQSRAPVYSLLFPYNREEARQESIESLNREHEKLWLALSNGRIVGYQFFMPASAGRGTGEMLIAENYSYLAVAATREEAQGRGVARALTARGIADEYATGSTHCITDWRATNLLSSRFWPRQGFRPAAYRLSRRLDERILWANQGTSARNWSAPDGEIIPFNLDQ